MQKILTVAALLPALVTPALAAPDATPYALSAVHADFQAQLDEIAGRPDAVGAAARAAAGAMAPHNAAQERLVLPLLGLADALAAGRVEAGADLPDRGRIEAELSHLYDGDVTLVTALVELYATADEAEDSRTVRLAETMIWHETSDIEVLYPAALLVGSTMQAQAAPDRPAADPAQPGAFHGAHAVPVTDDDERDDPGDDD